MFPLRDRTRRWICRTIFLAVGAAPTLSIIGWCMAMTSPGHVADVRSQFSDALGLDLRFEKFSMPRSGSMLLEGLEIADPETGESLAHIGQLEMRAGEQHPMWIISAAEINAARADWLLRLIERRLQVGVDGRSVPLRVIAAELSLRYPGGSQSFVDGDFQFSAHENGRSLAGVVRTVNSAAPAPIEIKVDRSLDATGAPGTTVEIHSVDVPLPVELFTTLTHLENHLGTPSTWQGTMELLESTHRWRGDFQGQLKDVDLHAAVSKQFPQQLNGRAEIDINRLAIDRGRLESCEGTVRACDGSVSGSLLAAASRLKLQAATFSGPTEQLFMFNELHFDYSIDSTGIGIIGRCGTPEVGIIMRSQNVNMLINTSRVKVSTAAFINLLVNVLVLDDRQLVPATEQANWLLQVLPITGEQR